MTAIYWRNLEKRWQNGETESQENGGVRQAHPPARKLIQSYLKSGCKNSGMECWKKMLCLEILSKRYKYTTNLCIWNRSIFTVCWKYGGCRKYFLQYGILLCAVTKATVLPLNLTTEKKQYSGGRNLANPETLCTIFLHPWLGRRGIVGFRLED